MEIMKSKSKPIDNNIIKEIELFKEKSERKLSYQDQYVINKTHAIELVSTPKRIVTSFSFVNKVQSETVEINSNKKDGRVKRSGSCQIRNKNNNKNNKITKNVKTSNIVTNRDNKTHNKNNRINKANNKPRSKIIKSIDLTKEGLSSLTKKINIFKRRIKSISNMNHIQINIIQNEIIFVDNNYIKKNNIKKKEIGLNKNYSQNYYFDLSKNRNSESKLIKSKLGTKNSSKLKNRNRIPVSKLHNRSVDTKSRISTKREPINMKKNKNIKKEILVPSRKDNSSINKFLKTPNKKEKMSVNTSSNMSSFYSPDANQNIVKNIFIDNTLSTPAKKKFIPLKAKKNKSIIFINNVKKDFTELNPTSKYYNNYLKAKKYQEKNNAHNSQIINLFSHPNNNESDKKNKKVNISLYKYSKSPSKEHMKQNNANVKSIFSRKTNTNNDSKIVNTEKSKTNSKNKKKLRNNKSKIDLDKGDDKCMKTKLTLSKIRPIIKKYVGNNVLESKDNGIFKFICKTKFGKDELIFHIELISKAFDTLTFKGNLVKGETKVYKELLNKIKEKLS